MPTNDERAQARADELEMLLIREAVSLAALGLVLVLLSPAVQGWIRHQAWRLRQPAARKKASEEAMIAELRRDLSRIEHEGIIP